MKVQVKNVLQKSTAAKPTATEIYLFHLHSS